MGSDYYMNPPVTEAYFEARRAGGNVYRLYRVVEIDGRLSNEELMTTFIMNRDVERVLNGMQVDILEET